MVDAGCTVQGKFFGYSELGGNGYCGSGHSVTTCRAEEPKAKVAGYVRI